MDKKKLIYWGTLALIAFFFIEFFWPLLYSDGGAAQATPTPEAAKSFYGRAVVSGNVAYLAPEGFASCNSSPSGFVNALRGVGGVKSVFAASGNGFVFSANASNESDAGEAFAGVAELVESSCGEGSGVLRNAGLELEGESFELSGLQSFNETRAVKKSDLESAFASFGGRGVEGFIDYSTSVNASIQLFLTVTMLGDSVVDKPQLEQVRYSQQRVEVE